MSRPNLIHPRDPDRDHHALRTLEQHRYPTLKRLHFAIIAPRPFREHDHRFMFIQTLDDLFHRAGISSALLDRGRVERRDQPREWLKLEQTTPR